MEFKGITLLLQCIFGLIFVGCLILNKIFKGRDIWQIAVLALLITAVLAMMRAAG